uniref:Glutamate--cysteine ligase n=1 Tax=Trichuris muris TaxID=70415 RepID=A0A5S6Q6Z0_TRIMR
MGLLSTGEPLEWSELKDIVERVKLQGVQQFINLYKRLKDRHGDCLRWGDEVEYLVVKFDHSNRRVRVCLVAEKCLETLTENETTTERNQFLWRPEYASYMVEGTPGQPYSVLSSVVTVEMNMRQRRNEIARHLGADEVAMSFGNFPRLGCADFCWPPAKTTPYEGFARSLFFPDAAIFAAHPRFHNLTRNIRMRRGSKVAINVPIYRDVNTPKPFLEDYNGFGPAGDEAKENALPDHIYMDAMGFGMGCCCLQVTFQAVDVEEARWLYDQLTPITPIVLALSASTPIYRGYLADVDCRWNIIAASVDDRTPAERGLVPLPEGAFRLTKSRYDSIDLYIHPSNEAFNDLPICYDERLYDMLTSGGVDPLLSKHVAHLFTRDPLQVFKDRVDQDIDSSTEHFETIQSSNWQNMRFKPPPIDAPNIGWRVEFRPTELQLTDFENAAFVCFIVVLTRVILSYRLSFLIPMSKVNENMKRAQRRNAVVEEKFYFRKLLTSFDKPATNGSRSAYRADPQTCNDDDITEMTVDEIVNGKPPYFPGLINLCHSYLNSAEVTVETRYLLCQYLKLIRDRASGRLWTLARWMREFVQQHPDYNKDSVVSEDICYDMLNRMHGIETGVVKCHELLGQFSCTSCRWSQEKRK